MSLFVIINVEQLKAYKEQECSGGGGTSNIIRKRDGACIWATVNTSNGTPVQLRHPATACYLVQDRKDNAEAWLASLNRMSFTCYVNGEEGVTHKTVPGYDGWIVMLPTGLLLGFFTVIYLMAAGSELIAISTFYHQVAADGQLEFWDACYPPTDVLLVSCHVCMTNQLCMY